MTPKPRPDRTDQIKSWMRRIFWTGLVLCSPSVSAQQQETQITWQITTPASQATIYKTQAEAAEAIKTLPPPSDLPPGVPNPFPHVDTIKGTAVTDDGKTNITYWMGLTTPLDPEYRYSNLMGSGSFLPTLEEGEASLIQFANTRLYESCPPSSKIISATPWRDDPSAPDMIGTRNYTLEVLKGANTEQSPCVVGQHVLPLNRYRYMQCPKPFTRWMKEYGACANDQIVAVVTTNQIIEKCDETGNPCNVKTGEKIEHQTDFDLGWIALVRSYHSSIGAFSGGFGMGWTHSLDLRLSISPNTIGLSGGAGYQTRFKKVGNGYVAADDSGDQVVGSGTQWVLYRQNDVLTFNNTGRLIEQRAENGIALAYTYDAYGRLAKVTHSTGRSLQFLYAGTSGDALITSITSEGATLASYAYTAGQQVETVTFPGGTYRKYHYEDTRFPRHLTGVTIEGQIRYSTFAYDAKGRVISSQHEGGKDGVTLSYLPLGGTVVTDALGYKTTYGLTDRTGALPRRVGDVIDDRGALGRSYNGEGTDFRGRPASDTNRSNVKTTYAYAEANDPVTAAPARTVTSTEALGTAQQRVVVLRHDIASNRLIYSATANRETRTVRNGRLQPISATLRDTTTNETRTASFAYCEAADVAAANSSCPILGLPKSVDGPRSDVIDVVRFEYFGSDDSTCATQPALCTFRKGDLRKTVDALGRATEVLGYDPQGHPLSVIDANGVVTDYEYNARGWLTATKVRGADNAVETDDRITRVEHWPTGLVKKVTQPGNVATSYTYDAAQRLTRITDNAGNYIQYTLDLAGNREQEDTKTSSGTLKQTLSRVYNILGQLESLKDASQNPIGFRYDKNGNPDRVTDALLRKTDQAYDPLDRLVTALQDVDKLKVETNLEYNAFDQVTKVKDPNRLSTDYAYNGFGDQTKLTSPDTGVTDYTYNAAGLLATKKDANDAVAHRYTYDALNRPKAIFYTAAGPADVEYDYDTVNSVCAAGENFALGRVTAMRADGTELKYCYDRFGQVVRKVQTVSGKSFILRYGYTVTGQLRTMTYPDGTVVDYLRDGQLRIKEIGVKPPGIARTILLNNATYEPFGPVTGWTYGNGRTLSRTYDLDYRAKTVFDQATGGLSLGYAYNVVGELTQLKDGLQSTVQAQYDYDTVGRLVATRDGSTGTALETYEYDPSGNRKKLLRGGITDLYVVPSDTHRLSSVAGVSRAYDAVGNTTSIGGSAKEYVYNANDRMKQVKLGGVVKMGYRYNAIGERVAAVNGDAGPVTAYTLYDEGGQWIGDYDSTGTATQQAIWMDSLPVGLLVGAGSGQSFKYVQPDQLGTPRTVIDPARNVAIWTWDAKSEVFGNSPPNQDPDLDGTSFVFNMRFPGQRHDPNTGLSYNYFRDYDPVTGRYVQSDPTGLDGGISTYGYANLDPATTSDPSGLKGVRVRGNGNGGYTARFDPINTQATATINQIQSLNPQFQYQTIGPRGQSFTRHDITTLNQIQFNTRAAYQTLWPSSCPARNSRSNDQLVREIARRAEAWGNRQGLPPSGGGSGQGTRKHKYAQDLLQRYQEITGGNRNLLPEASFKNGRPENYGTRGSVRLDVYDPVTGRVWDYKFTPNPSLPPSRVQQIITHGPPGINQVDIVKP
ncbi:RHS repeat-associated core domain-containing protein [Lysobacter sp. CA199]|uniref:RHS repeat-associated core domain-containing protein n=1 Tax=Lysobacter sp. CA199 TaxID=3455608 RepID=UPI003F8D3636